jgi:predicted SprT family Zn-dependent metalloprotease
VTEQDLIQIFNQINREHFEGTLALPILRWNKRLRTSAGRFLPGGRLGFTARPPKIEIAHYLLQEEKAQELIADTLGHEMIHYWLWSRRRPYGHNSEFWRKMKAMGVSRYNPVPKQRAYKYVYLCPGCQKEFPARKKLKALACAPCCKRHGNGKFDKRFLLVLGRAVQEEPA